VSERLEKPDFLPGKSSTHCRWKNYSPGWKNQA